MREKKKDPPILKLFSIIHWQTRIFIEKKLGPYDLSWGELHILIRLYKWGDGVTQKRLSQDLRISKATTSKMVRKLEEEGYIMRKKGTRDARCYRVYLTEKEKKLSPILKEIREEGEGILFEGFTEKEKESLIKDLNKIIENITEANKGDCYE
ncbi:MAG: MarR family transcriptional regulator [Euryarchaeota archaeon]|nr:MarR family transcriptional regulator [Euryarchaeota archaeon]